MKRIHVVMLVLFSVMFLMGANKCKDPVEKITKEPQKLLNSEWLPVYQSDLQIPTLIVKGANGEMMLDPGCLKQMTPTETSAGEEITFVKQNKEKIATDLKLALKATLKKAADLDASISFSQEELLFEQWEVKLEGATYYNVNISEIKPNWENDACKIPDLKWFTDNRSVVAGLVKVETISITSGLSMSESMKSALELMFTEQTGTVEGNFSAKFEKITEVNGSYTLKASDVFVLYRPAKLFANVCQINGSWDVEFDHLYKNICGCMVKVKPISDTDQYKVYITFSGQTSEFTMGADVMELHPLNDQVMAGMLLNVEGDKVTAIFNKYLVGGYGAEN